MACICASVPILKSSKKLRDTLILQCPVRWLGDELSRHKRNETVPSFRIFRVSTGLDLGTAVQLLLLWVSV